MKQTRWDKYGDGIVIHETEILESEAVFAAEIITRWGAVASAPDGEDSSGRSKLRLMTPEELVARSFETAGLFMKHARENNLVHNPGNIDDFFDDKD